MRIWKNTATLAGYDEGLTFTEVKNEAEIVLMGSKPIDLDEFPKIRGIFRAGIGRDNVPIAEADKRGVKVAFPATETVDMIFEETANFACSLVLRMVYQNIGSLDPWFKEDRLQLSSKHLLVIGTGNIGSRVVKKMSQFMSVDTFDSLNDKDEILIAHLQQADCVSIHIPNTLENKGYFDKKMLEMMKDGAILVNTARGAIVDEDALYEEVRSGRLKAAFDVYWKEPYRGKLAEFHPERFFMTPHVASTCSGFLLGCRSALDMLIKELVHD